MSVKVSVVMIAYNHEQFIEKAIESIICQKTDFSFELVIGEDFSTDQTREICERYLTKYPNLIRLLPSDKNYGMMPNLIRTLNSAKGEYLALCEGDDYWIDEYKLQKQCDFLSTSPTISLVGGLSKQLSNDGFNDMNFEEGEFNTKDLVVLHRCHTSTYMFRKRSFEIPSWFDETKAGDTAIIWLNSLIGNIFVIGDYFSVYRIHDGGVISSLDEKKKHQQIIENLEFFKKHIPQLKALIEKKIRARKSYFNLYDYRLMSVFTGETPFFIYLKKIIFNKH